MNKEAGRTQISFHFSPASSYVLPLQNIRQRIRGIWESLTWPVIKRILKADLAATIAFALLMIEPIRRLTDYGIILAQVAVHFIHPAKSYGQLVEDIVFGTLMCIVSTAWSLLGTFCASLVRNPDDPTLAQPKVSGVLAIFLVVGTFCLNYVRARMEQANLGGMLSATILVISLTSGVLDTQWYPRTVLQTFVPVMVGFGIVFVIGIILWPENSTRICVEQLVKTLETFDGIARRQAEGFLHMGNPRDESIYLSASGSPPPESLPVVHRMLDSALCSLVEKKRIVRREISFNYIAPKDISEMTKLLKKMLVPLQGVSLSRVMEENMRKAHLQRHVARRLEEFAEKESMDSAPADASYATLQNATNISMHGGGGDDDNKPVPTAPNMSCASLSSMSSSCVSFSDSDDQGGSPMYGNRMPTPVNPALETPPPVEEGSGISTRKIYVKPKIAVKKQSDDHDDSSDKEYKVKKAADSPDTHITIALPPDDGYSAWRREYSEILKTVRPIYHSLLQACSSAVHDTTIRLQYLQRIDPQFQNKPWIYRLFVKKEQPCKFDKDVDPSIQLLKAIQEFDMHRLCGLERLYHPGDKPIPRRILFLLLHFQFNLRGYAERVYTLSSLVHEMIQAREKRRVWMPHLSPRKFFERRQMEADVGLDPPTTIVEAHHMESLQRTLSHRATHIMLSDDLNAPTVNEQALPRRANILSLPKRGELRNRRKRSMQQRGIDGDESGNGCDGGLDPLMYHDPDVAYPTTPFQRFCYNLWRFWARHVRTADTAFALRACAVVIILALPGFIEESHGWYNRARGQWAAVVAIVWMGPSVGSNFFGVMVRTVGTFIGAVCSILVWEISRVNRVGLTLLMFFFGLPWWLIYLNGKFWKASGLFSLITTSIIIGYAYNYQMSGKNISMYEVLYERTVCVLIGVVVALIFSVFPLPRTGRVELRHRIARTLGDLAALYSSFLALLLKNAQRDPNVSVSNRKVFRAVAAAILKQIKGQRVLLEQSRFEPALRGIFPEDKYVHILQTLENMVCLMIDMEYALECIPERWRMQLVQNTWKERKTAIASFLTALHMGANALSNKCPLPPYVLRPTRARRDLTNKARQIRNLRPDRLADPEYTYYGAYLMSSEQLAAEIESLIATIRDLVGPDSVSVWLEYKH